MTIKITKKSISLNQGKLYQVTLNLRYLDETAILIDKDFTQEINRTTDSVAVIINKFKTEMQKTIDEYKAEQVIFNSTALDNAIIVLQSALTT